MADPLQRDPNRNPLAGAYRPSRLSASSQDDAADSGQARRPNLHLPDFGSSAYSSRPSEGDQELETLRSAGHDLLEAWQSGPVPEGGVFKTRGEIAVRMALVGYYSAHHRESMHPSAAYVAQLLSVPELYLVDPSAAPKWPRSSGRPDPYLKLFPSRSVRVDWSGYQVIEVFWRLEQTRNPTANNRNRLLSDRQRLYLLQLFFLDVLAESEVDALRFDWSPDLWERLDERLGIFPAYQTALESVASLDYEVAEAMALEVEHWTIEKIAATLGRKDALDREILPVNEIAFRILRVFSQFHNAINPTATWDIPTPPSQRRSSRQPSLAPPERPSLGRRATHHVKQALTIRSGKPFQFDRVKTETGKPKRRSAQASEALATDPEVEFHTIGGQPGASATPYTPNQRPRTGEGSRTPKILKKAVQGVGSLRDKLNYRRGDNS
ncbi:hypothetical protein JCM16303_002196 [Sporobolomyces ruberrimus]